MRELSQSFEGVLRDDTQWRNAHGEVLEISEMDYNYLINIISMLKRKSIGLKENYEIPDMMINRIEKYKITNPEYFL